MRKRKQMKTTQEDSMLDVLTAQYKTPGFPGSSKTKPGSNIQDLAGAFFILWTAAASTIVYDNIGTNLNVAAGNATSALDLRIILTIPTVGQFLLSRTA